MEYISFIVGTVFGAAIALILGTWFVKRKESFGEDAFKLMKEELQAVSNVVSSFEKERGVQYGQLSEQLRTTAETTGRLQTALTSTNPRGQWGERMAEDILRLCGFIEGVNYFKQQISVDTGSRPDYTFPLPQGFKVNMDTKFPFDNYWKYCGCDNDLERQQHKDKFLKNVKDKIKEVKKRDYINAEENTVDYVIMFIPNEQVYGFINEMDRSLLDEALQDKVIICSPLTLYAILAVIRQAMDNFNLGKKTSEILTRLGAFNKQWNEYVKSFENLGEKIAAAQKEFDYLTTTRRKKLEVQIRKVEDLRKREGLSDSLTEDAIFLEESDGHNSKGLSAT